MGFDFIFKKGNWTATLDRKRLKINGKGESERAHLRKYEHGESIAKYSGKETIAVQVPSDYNYNGTRDWKIV